jgi:hypothetical protein
MTGEGGGYGWNANSNILEPHLPQHDGQRCLCHGPAVFFHHIRLIPLLSRKEIFGIPIALSLKLRNLKLLK